MKLIKTLMVCTVEALFGIVKWTLILFGILYLYETGILEGILDWIDNATDIAGIKTALGG